MYHPNFFFFASNYKHQVSKSHLHSTTFIILLLFKTNGFCKAKTFSQDHCSWQRKSFFPPPPPAILKLTTYILRSMFHCHFLSFFFLLPQLCEGGRAFYFWSSVLLHTTYISIYSHITTTRTTEKVCCFCCCWLCFAAISVLSQILIKRLSQLSTQLFSLGFKGKKTYKGESHFGKTLLGFDLKKFRIIHFIWDSPSFHFLFPSTHEVHILPSLKVNLYGKIIFQVCSVGVGGFPESVISWLPVYTMDILKSLDRSLKVWKYFLFHLTCYQNFFQYILCCIFKNFYYFHTHIMCQNQIFCSGKWCDLWQYLKKKFWTLFWPQSVYIPYIHTCWACMLT